MKDFVFQKKTFTHILLILVIVLALMPFVSTFNDLLTRAVMRLDFYRYIQNVIVPWEVRMVGVILYPLGFQPSIVGEYLAIGGSSTPFGRSEQFLIEIAWNCIGWQSLLFFIITTFVGLQ